MFPHATVDDLRQLQEMGWSRLGVATAVVNERGELLMLEHAESYKHREGAVGPVMETTRVRAGEVESTEQTMYRALQEELGVESPEELSLRARILYGWTLHRWPVGFKVMAEHVLGINPVVVIPDDKADKIGRFINTDEIRRAEFMPVERVMIHERLRPGVLEWLGGLTSRGLLDRRHGTYHPVNFDTVQDTTGGDWADAVFAEVSL